MYSAIYWMTRLDEIKGTMTAICITGAVLLLLAFFLAPMLLDEDFIEISNSTKKKVFKWIIGVTAFCVVVNIFLPSKNDLILIYAGGKAYEYVKSDTSLQKLPYKTTEYLKLILDKEIKEVKKEVEHE